MPAIIPPAAAEQEHEPDDVVPYRCRGPCGQMVTHKPCTICAAIARTAPVIAKCQPGPARKRRSTRR